MSLLTDAANEVLGAGVVSPGSSLFGPIETLEGSSLTERTRHTQQVMEGRARTSDIFADIVQNNARMQQTILQTEASRNEVAALDQIKRLDPLSGEFDEAIMEFLPMAAYSRPIAQAIDIKTDRAERDSGMLTELGANMIDAGSTEGQVETTLRTAADLLRQGPTGRAQFYALANRVNRRVNSIRSRMDASEREAQGALKQFAEVRDRIGENFPDLAQTYSAFLQTGSDKSPIKRKGASGVGVVVEEVDAVASFSKDLISQLVPHGAAEVPAFASVLDKDGELSPEVAEEIARDVRSLTEAAFVAKWGATALGGGGEDAVFGVEERLSTVGKDLLKSVYNSVSDVYSLRQAAQRLPGRTPEEGEGNATINTNAALDQVIALRAAKQS